MGTTIRTTPEHLGQLERKLAGRIEHVRRRAAMSAALRSVKLMQDRTRQAPPANPAGIGRGGAVNTGDYLRRWRAARMHGGDAVVYNSSPYAGVIDLGRRKGSRMPPVERIARWMQRRLGMSLEDARGAAFVVAQKIAERGLIGRRVMTHPDAQRRMSEMFLEEFEHELAAEISKLAREEADST